MANWKDLRRQQGYVFSEDKEEEKKSWFQSKPKNDTPVWKQLREQQGHYFKTEPTDYWKEQPVRALGKNINAGFNMLPRGMVGIADATVGGLGIKPVNKVLDSYKDYYKKADEELAMLNQGHEFAGGVAQGIGQAIPTMALALMNPAAAAGNALTTAKGTQLVANAASLANPTTLNAARTVALQLKSNPTLYSSMVTSVGNQYLQGLNEGASREEAIKSAIIGGVPSGLIEVSGGIENLANIMANKTKGLVGVALQAAIEEGFEEIVQYPIENIGQKVAYDKAMPLFSMKEQAVINPKEMAFSGAVGATVGGLMGGGAAGVNTALYKNYSKQLDTMYKNTIDNLPEDSPILERVRLMQDDNVNIDDNTKIWVINSARQQQGTFESETDKLLQNDRQKETFFSNENNAQGQTVEQGQNIVKTQNTASQAVNPVLSTFNIQNINNAREVKQNIYEFYKNSIISDSNISKPIINKGSGMIVEVSRATINQTFQADEKYAKNQDNEIKVAAMANVVDLIQNGEFTVVDNSDTPSSKVKYAEIKGAVNFNNVPYEITMDIRRTDNGRKLFVHSLSTNYQQVSGKKSGVIYNGVDERVRQQYPKVYDILDRIGETTNTKFKFVDTIYDPTGQIPGFANGQYDPTTDSIEIALDTFNPFMVVAKHEVTHMLEKESPKLYKEYKDYVLSAMKENGEYDVQYERMAELYRSRGLEVDKNAIEDELVADATELFLTDENAINNLVAENKTLGQKILDVLRKLIEKIEDILEVARFTEGWMNTEQLRQAEKLWVNALSGVAKKQSVTPDKQSDVKNSLKKYSKDGKKPIVKKSLKEYNVSEIESTILTNHNEYNNNKEALKLAAEAIKDLQEVKFSISSTGREVDWDRAGIKTIADGISREFINKGYVELKGRKINSLEELAVIGQIFRDPRFETFRIIYTKNNKIVAHEGISSRIPGFSSAFLNVPKRSEYSSEHDYQTARNDFSKTRYDDMKDRMKRLKADGYYLLHNHPSGSPDASKQDVYLTKNFMDNVDGFKGHVIINSNKYGWLEMGKLGYSVHVEDMTQQQIELFLKPTIKHPLLNESINGADKAASIAKSLQLSKDKTAIVYTDVKGVIRGIEEIPNGMFNDRISIRGFLRNRGRHFGSGWAFLSTTSQDIFGKSANLVKEKYLMDSILLTGGDNYYSHRADTGIAQDDDYAWAGIEENEIKATRANEENEVFYTPQEVEIIKNPTNKQLEQLRADFRKEFPELAKQGEPPTRRTYDIDGNVYYWKSADGLHYNIENWIDKKFNTQTEQNKYFDIKYSLKPRVENSDYKDIITVRDDGEISFKKDAELPKNIWSKIHTRFRRLGYMLHDVDDTKRYILKGNPLNLDQSKAVIDVLGLAEKTEQGIAVEKAKKYATKAARHFGTTNNFKLAGYLTINGSLLDFSEGQGYRVQDHREIQDILDFIPDGAPISQGMIEFMNQGNIRLQSYGIDISVKPNSKQRMVLRKFFDDLNGEAVVDFSREDGGNAGSVEYPQGTRSDRILRDIDKFFDTGELPQISDVQRFRYSLKDSQGRTLTQEQAEYFKDSKVRDKEGNLLVVYHGSKNNEPFSVFKKGSGAYGFLWATSLEHEANRYANRVDKGKVYKLYADIKNPKYFKAKRFSDSPENYVQNLKSEYDGAIIEYELPLYWKDYHYETTSPTSDWYRIPIGVNLSELYAKNDGVMRVIAVRNSNQFKETTNKEPSNDADIRYQLREDEGNLGYHAGDLGKAESYWNIMSGNRSTGHFGTGTYFVGNKEAINLDGYKNRPQHGVDFSDYKLYKPYNYRHGIKLHDFLKDLNYNLRHLTDAKKSFEEIFEEFYSYKKAVDDVGYGFWKEDEGGMKEPEFIKAKEKLDNWADENLGHRSIRYEKGSNGYYEELFKLIEEDNERRHELRRWYEFDLDHSSIDLGISRSKMNKIIDEVYNEVKDIDFYSDESMKGDSISTRFMKKLGYDGIDVRHIKELDNTMYGSVIYDVKEPSIKYQLRDNTSVKDIEKLQNTVTRLKEQFKLTKGVKLDEKSVRRLSKAILKDYGSKYSSTELETKLYNVYMGMINGTMEYDEAHSIINEAAREIIENASILNDAMYRQYSELRNTMRNTAISIDDRYKGDFDAVGGWNDFRKRNFGRINIASDGMSIDKLYQELSDLYPELFLKDVANPADQLMLISDVLDGLVPIYENPYNRELNEAVEYLALEIFDGMTSVPEAKPTFADRKKAEKQKAVKVEKDKSKTRIEAIKNKNADDVAWLKYQNKEKLAEVLQKEKAKRDEAVAKVRKRYQDKAYKTWWRNKLNENDIKSHYQEMIKELRSRRDEKLEQQKTKYKERISGIYEDRKIRQAKDRIRAMAKKLGKMLRSPTQKQHVPKALDKTIAELLTMLDFTTDRQKEITQIKLRDLRAEYEKIAKVSDEEGLSATADPYIVEALEILHDKRIVEMNLQEIELLRDIVSYFENMVRTYNKAFLGDKWVDVSSKAEGIIKDLKTDTPADESAYGGILYFKDMMNWGMLTPQMYFERMGNTFNSLYDDFRAALDKKINNTKIAQDYMSDLLKNSKDKISQWTGKKAKIKTVKLDSGKTIELTQSQLMSFYLLMKREQARGHIFGLGIKAAPIVAVDKKGMRYVKKQFEPVKITLDDATKMIAMLSKEQRHIADGIGKFMNTYSKQWVNEATLQNYGYELAKEENYFPIKVDRDFLKSDFDNTNLDPTFTSMGFLKATIKGAGNAIILEDVFDVFTEHADKAATYNAFVGVTESTKKIVNYKTQDNSIKQAMNKKFGIQAFNYLKKFMVDLQGGIRTESGSPVVTGLIRKSKRAVLGLNLRTIIQQPTAIVRATALIDADYLIKGVAMKSDKAEMLEKSPIARWKSWGYFNLDTGRSMKDIILDSVPLLDKQYQGMQIADDITWTKIWNAVKLEIENNEPGLKVGSAEYFDAVNYRFNEIIDRTQVVDTVMHRSDAMRQSDSSWKILTAFMSEPTKSYNLLLNAVEKYNANKSVENKKVLLRTFSAWTATMLVNTLVISMLDMWRRKEDDKETFKEKWIDNILNDVTGYVPIVRDIYSLFEGYSVKRMEYNGIERIVRAINRSKKYVEEMAEDEKHSYPLRLITKDWIESVAYVFGVGALNVSKDLEALLRNYTRWIDDEGAINEIYEFMFKK